MINYVIDILNTRIGLSGLVSQKFGLTELVTDSNGQTSPKEYCGNGQWNEVSKFDNNSGTSYWRKNGDISMSETNGFIACDRFIDFSIPLFLVLVVRKSVMNDNQYTPDNIATVITSDLVGNSATLKSAITARRASISVISYDTDSEAIMSREYSNVEATRLRTDYAHISLNIVVNISIKSTCIPNDCSPSDACARLLASLTRAELLECILPWYDFANSEVVNSLSEQQELDLQNALCDVSTVEINGTLYGTIPGGATEDIPVINSASTPLGTVNAGINVVIEDITKTDTDGTTSSIPAGVNVTCTPTASLTCAQLNAGLSDSQRQTIQRITPIKTGQTTSYRTGDDGDLEKGRLPTFTTLTCNNGFGNTNRFTDELGGQTYTNNLVCDWATGLMWYRVLSGLVNWNTAIDNAEASTQASYTDWRIPNMNEMMSIINAGTGSGLDYSPFNQPALTSNAFLWTSTTALSITTWAQTWFYGHVSVQYRGILDPIIKTNSTQGKHYLCRNFTLSDLGL